MGCPVVELRRYTLHPGARDTLIELFDRELVETQDAVGARVLGQFRDRDDPDQFVWLRGFEDMDVRRDALEAFYGGPVWAAHKDAANATMVAFDDVLLLTPERDDTGLALPDQRSGPAADLIVTIDPLEPVGTPPPAPEALASFVTLRVPNTFPSLPVREDVHVCVRVWREAPEEVGPAGRVTLRLAPTPRSLLR
ncbi:MAG: NIPSNAP family protein [Solirubrobacteraceae bacterium]